MLAGERPTVNGTGEQERDYVYVADVARINVLALTGGGGRMYNVGTGVGTSVNALVDRLAEIIGYTGATPRRSAARRGLQDRRDQRAREAGAWLGADRDLDEGLRLDRGEHPQQARASVRVPMMTGRRRSARSRRYRWPCR